MGYTHYWRFNHSDRTARACVVEKRYQTAIKACDRIVKAFAKEERLSGYSAHAKGYGGICFNGAGEDGHQTFSLREHANQNDGLDFCKTDRKPYDTAVVACLAVLKYYLGDSISVSSDGKPEDWREGVEFAKKVLNRKTIKGI